MILSKPLVILSKTLVILSKPLVILSKPLLKFSKSIVDEAKDNHGNMKHIKKRDENMKHTITFYAALYDSYYVL